MGKLWNIAVNPVLISWKKGRRDWYALKLMIRMGFKVILLPVERCNPNICTVTLSESDPRWTIFQLHPLVR